MALGASLRRAWAGYRERLDRELAAAGFASHGTPDGRVLRLCSETAEVTISEIGRELGITRQAASKIVAALRDRGYVSLSPSPTDRREKMVGLTAHALDYLRAQRAAERRIEARLRRELGPEAFDGLHRLLEALDARDTRRSQQPAGLVE
ncbi:MAG: MarR family winged helix-turn-helix transcriptional regulator [Solirubrobacteraceae bacterium]